MNQAMLMGVDGFAALNQLSKNGQQEVWMIIEGSSVPLDDFSAFAQTKRPDSAEVSDVIIKDFEGFVPRIGEGYPGNKSEAGDAIEVASMTHDREHHISIKNKIGLTASYS